MLLQNSIVMATNMAAFVHISDTEVTFLETLAIIVIEMMVF